MQTLGGSGGSGAMEARGSSWTDQQSPPWKNKKKKNFRSLRPATSASAHQHPSQQSVDRPQSRLGSRGRDQIRRPESRGRDQIRAIRSVRSSKSSTESDPKVFQSIQYHTKPRQQAKNQRRTIQVCKSKPHQQVCHSKPHQQVCHSSAGPSAAWINLSEFLISLLLPHHMRVVGYW